MIKRVLWLGVGLAVGVLVVRKMTHVAEAFTPRGIASNVGETAGGLLGSVRSFVEDVRSGAAEREAEINAAFLDGSLITHLDTESDE